MTDWYFGHGVGDFVAQKDQEYFDRLPSPDSWSQWETCGIGGNSGWANSYDSGNTVNAKPQQQTLFSRAGNQDIDGEQSHGSTDFGGSSEDSRPLFRNSAACVRPDYYFNDLAETDPADDIFLNSLLEDDVLPLQSLYIAMPSDSDSTNKLIDFQSISCDTDGGGSLKYFTNSNFSCSNGSDDGHGHVSKFRSRTNSDQSSCPSVKVMETKDLVPSDHKAPMRTSEVNDLSSIEESVLTGLEAVLNQLSEKTRLCLRDSMYRLAEHSEKQTSKKAQVEGLSLDEPSLPETSDVCSRSRVTDIAESETNAIDRAVAYMMFNKNANEQDHLPASPPEFAYNGRNFAVTEDMKTSDLPVQCEAPVFNQQTQGQSYQSGFGAAEDVF